MGYLHGCLARFKDQQDNTESSLEGRNESIKGGGDFRYSFTQCTPISEDNTCAKRLKD